MKVCLVTGAAGFSAKYLIEELRKGDWIVYTTDIITPKDLEDPFGFHLCDITKPDELKDLFDKCVSIDVVFHVASVFDYSASEELLEKVNVEGTKNLIEACKEHKVGKMVLWSSLAAYGEVSKKTYDLPVTEDQPLSSMKGGLYDQSKRNQEIIALTSGFPITILRPAPIYGYGSKYGFFTLLKYIRDGVLYEVPRNMINRSMPMIHAKDLARAAIHLSDPDKYISQIYNIVDLNSMNLLDTVKFCAFLMGIRLRVIIPMKLKPFKPMFMLFGKLSAWIAKKKGLERPVLETDAMSYMFGNYAFSCIKLLGTGFYFDYPDRRNGLLEMIQDMGWVK